MSRPRIYSDEERKERAHGSQQRSRAHNGYHSTGEPHDDSAGVGDKDMRSLALSHVRRLRRFAKMCEVSARLWLLDRGYDVNGAFSASASRRRVAKAQALKVKRAGGVA